MYTLFNRPKTKKAKKTRRKATSAFADLWKLMLFPSVPQINMADNKTSKKTVRSRSTKIKPRVLKKNTKPKSQGKSASNSYVPPLYPSTKPRGAKFIKGLHTCEHGERSYKLYIPAFEKNATKSLPLVVMLHGCNQSSDDFARGTQMNRFAEEFGFYVVYPNQGRKSQTYRCWNWYKRNGQKRGQGEPALIASLTKQIISDYDVDAARVYIAGLSAGASIALITANKYPDIFAAVGAHSGLPVGAAHDAASAVVAMKYGMPGLTQTVPMPTINFHGDADKVVNAKNSDYIMERAAEPYTGLKVRQKTGYAPSGQKYIRTSYRVGRGRSFIERWLLIGAGHAWSGGSNIGSYTNPSGPEASREMIRFFWRHRTTQKWRKSFSAHN